MLRDTPIAYGVRFDIADDYSETEWRYHAGSGGSAGNVLLVAIGSDGSWIGTMGGYVDRNVGGPVLYGVYVAPSARGQDAGVTDALLDAVEAWARTDFATIRLEVHEDNARARAAYAKRGYVETGHRRPYVLDPTREELEMIKQLR
jgi:GNAT superfamily N-acetyltransferase